MSRCKRCAAKVQKLEAELKTTKLRVETAKLDQIEVETKTKLQAQTPKYTRYVDMPPPTPEEEAEFDREFQDILARIFEQPMGPEAGQTVQDWLTEQGAVIPDLPDWRTPLYLEQWG